MAHTVGSPLTKKRLGRVFVSYNHNAVRKYYMTRNTLYMRHHFGEFGDKYLKLIFMDIVNIIFIEEDKYNKLKSILKGFSDYFMGRMGPMDSAVSDNLPDKQMATRKRRWPLNNLMENKK